MTVTLDAIKTVVRLQFGLRDVSAKAHIVEELGAESLDIVNLITALEEKYRICIADDELLAVQTVLDLYELVKRHVG